MKKVKMGVTKLYKTSSEMSDSDFTSHETDEFIKVTAKIVWTYYPAT